MSINSTAGLMRDCCSTTLQYTGVALKQIGSWMGQGLKKIVALSIPLFQTLGNTLKFAGVVAWANTKTFYAGHKKELGLVALGAGIVIFAIALVKAIHYCCTKSQTETA